MNATKELYVAEYSKSQGCFHIDRLDKSLDANQRIVMARAHGDYLPFAICDSQTEAEKACDQMERLQAKCGGSHLDDQRAAAERGMSEEQANRAIEETRRLDIACGVVA